ncbi:MAG TPA: hypothetical protein VJT13_15740 [Xanthobacteraceae bacterium]|nr:hypothetical protein [Xanthobacteraceae bacterium]
MIRRNANFEPLPLPRFGDRWLLRGCVSRGVDGLWVGGSSRYGDDTEPGLRRIEQALGLIKSHDPVRYRRLLRDVKRIWVGLTFSGYAEYEHALLACKLDERIVADETVSHEEIASAIVHEATHARLTNCGIGYDEPVRHRVESICLRREIAFARRLPDGGAIEEAALRALSLCSDGTNWTNAAMTERRLTVAPETLSYLGAPALIVRVAVGVVRWRIAARNWLHRLGRRNTALVP